MHQLIDHVEEKHRKPKVVDVRPGDTVRVHQKIKEGSKERVQVFEGFVIRTRRKNSGTSSITVRRIASGVGVEKSFLIHSPLIVQIEVSKRSKVRRNYLSYMRERHGKSARLSGVEFDKDEVNLSIEEQQNVDAGLDKDADIEEVEDKSAADDEAEDTKSESEDKKEAESQKSDDEKSDEKESEKSQDKESEGQQPEVKEESEQKSEKLSKEEKAKQKKEKAKAFQEAQDKK